MLNKIKSIREKVPTITTLPDGYYNGVWGGYIIEVKCQDKLYELETETGVKGIGIKVVVEITDGVATFSAINS
jgi:hypothetical protein